MQLNSFPAPAARGALVGGTPDLDLGSTDPKDVLLGSSVVTELLHKEGSSLL